MQCFLELFLTATIPAVIPSHPHTQYTLPYLPIPSHTMHPPLFSLYPHIRCTFHYSPYSLTHNAPSIILPIPSHTCNFPYSPYTLTHDVPSLILNPIPSYMILPSLFPLLYPYIRCTFPYSPYSLTHDAPSLIFPPISSHTIHPPSSPLLYPHTRHTLPLTLTYYVLSPTYVVLFVLSSNSTLHRLFKYVSPSHCPCREKPAYDVPGLINSSATTTRQTPARCLSSAASVCAGHTMPY